MAQHEDLVAFDGRMREMTGASTVRGHGGEWTWYEAVMVAEYGTDRAAWPEWPQWSDVRRARQWEQGHWPAWVRPAGGCLRAASTGDLTRRLPLICLSMLGQQSASMVQQLRRVVAAARAGRRQLAGRGA